MTKSRPEPFLATSYIGSEIAEFGRPGEIPPRSAKLVAQISWSWSPAHSRTSPYLLGTNKERSGWSLWEQGHDFDTGRRIYARVAWGERYRGYEPKFVAQELLTEVWRRAIKFGEDLDGGVVDEPGILGTREIAQIKQELAIK